MKWLRSNIPEAYKSDFYRTITKESIPKLKTLFFILAGLQALQLMSYILGDQEYLQTNPLYLLKALCIILCLSFNLVLFRVEKKMDRSPVLAEYLMASFVFLMLIWAVFNTFYAQKITSDISIYMLVIYSSVATARIKPPLMALMLTVSYVLFTIGMPHFQKNPVYVSSHRINALILIFTALVISILFFKHSVEEYLAKKDLSKKNTELEFLAKNDGLTGLFNHITIHEKLESSVQEALDTKRPMCLILLDIDFFKMINDQFGHKVGDKILRAIADYIKQNVRQKDFAGRYGGDEFMIVMTDTKVEHALGIAQNLLQDVRTIKIKDFSPSFSCGVAELFNDTATQLIERADKALYESKDRGRNCIVISKGAAEV